MSLSWDGWTPFEGSPGKRLQEVDRPTAKRYFDDLMAARPARREQLERLLARNGVEIGMDSTGLQRLDDWYRSNVAGDASQADRLAARWYAVGLDIGLYLGDAIRSRLPSVEWRLFTRSARDLSYQRPVLMGFPDVKNKHYNVDPELLVGIHGLRIVVGEYEPHDYFVRAVAGDPEHDDLVIPD